MSRNIYLWLPVGLILIFLLCVDGFAGFGRDMLKLVFYYAIANLIIFAASMALGFLKRVVMFIRGLGMNVVH